MADYDDIDDMDFLPEDMQVSAPTGNLGGSSSSSFASAGGFKLPTEQQRDEIRQTIKRFLCLYPIYYDADRSTTNGRVVSADLAFKGVTVWHVGEAVKRLGLPCIIEETKRHPRDPLTMGRVRTVLKQDGHTFNRKVTNRYVVLSLHKEIARLLPSVSEQVAVLLEERKQAELDEMKRMQAMMPPGMAGMGGMMNPLAGMLGGMGLEESQDGDAGATTKAADKKKKDKKKR